MTVVIANPVAHGSRRAVAALARRGVHDVRWTTADEHADVLARRVLDEGATGIVVVGGDGTVRDVAEHVAATTVPLGIMPAGTANLYARNLDLPLRSPERAARIALDGRVARVDLGRVAIESDGAPVRTLVFLVVVGIGHDASAVEAASTASKRRLGWAAYVGAGVRRFAQPPYAVHAIFDAEGAATEAWSVLVHNAARIPAGLRVVPGTRLDDGRLHVAVVSPKRLAHWGRIAASGMGMARAEGILSHRSTERVRLEADGIPAQVDGDAMGAVTAIEAWVEAGVLPVRVGKAA